MDQDSKSSKSKIVDVAKTVCAVVTVVYVFNIVCDRLLEMKVVITL